MSGQGLQVTGGPGQGVVTGVVGNLGDILAVCEGFLLLWSSTP